MCSVHSIKECKLPCACAAVAWMGLSDKQAKIVVEKKGKLFFSIQIQNLWFTLKCPGSINIKKLRYVNFLLYIHTLLYFLFVILHLWVHYCIVACALRQYDLHCFENAASDWKENLPHCKNPVVSVTVGNKLLKHKCFTGSRPSLLLFKVLQFLSVQITIKKNINLSQTHNFPTSWCSLPRMKTVLLSLCGKLCFYNRQREQ